MSIQRVRAIFKGKFRAGSGSILANLDAKTRKGFAKRANKAIEHRKEHEKEIALEKELKAIHLEQKALKQTEKEKKQHQHSLLYWLVSANFSEIWHHFFHKQK